MNSIIDIIVYYVKLISILNKSWKVNFENTLKLVLNKNKSIQYFKLVYYFKKNQLKLA